MDSARDTQTKKKGRTPDGQNKCQDLKGVLFFFRQDSDSRASEKNENAVLEFFCPSGVRPLFKFEDPALHPYMKT